MTKDDIPQEWRVLLAELQQNDPTAVLAGGAIRDLYCGVSPKDLDFFTKWNKDLIFFQSLPIIRSSDINYEGMMFVDAIVSIDKGPLPINIIIGSGYNTTTELIETFDFGICQIAFDGKNIIKTPAFDWDFKYGLFTLRMTLRQNKRSLQRFERISPRYPNFKIVQVEGLKV